MLNKGKILVSDFDGTMTERDFFQSSAVLPASRRRSSVDKESALAVAERWT
ncbi:MAG: hypothetical protein HXX17_11590 [Geobacteraceae bacterium]|nr:hypothetical protein [Geobacteraceae bacterium]